MRLHGHSGSMSRSCGDFNISHVSLASCYESRFFAYYTNFDSSALRCPCIMASVSVLDFTCISWCEAAFKEAPLLFSPYICSTTIALISAGVTCCEKACRKQVRSLGGFGVFGGLSCPRWLSTYIDPREVDPPICFANVASRSNVVIQDYFIES